MLVGSGGVCAQGFHHPPHHPPSPPHQPPPRPPSRPPTRFIPPPRPEVMRPPIEHETEKVVEEYHQDGGDKSSRHYQPSQPEPTHQKRASSVLSRETEIALPNENQKALQQWKNEVVDRVRDIADDHFDFDDESDVINIEDPWSEQNWGEHDTGDASFVDHNFEVTHYKFKPIPLKIGYINPNYPEFPSVSMSIDNWSMNGDFPDSFSINGPTYTLETLPDIAKQEFINDFRFLDTENPDLRFIIVYGDGMAGITVVAVDQTSPGVYITLDVVKSHSDIPHTFVNGDQIIEVSQEWKGVNIISLANSEFTEVDVKTINININDYTAPEPVAPIQQAEIATTPSDTPITPAEQIDGPGGIEPSKTPDADPFENPKFEVADINLPAEKVLDTKIDVEIKTPTTNVELVDFINNLDFNETIVPEPIRKNENLTPQEKYKQQWDDYFSYKRDQKVATELAQNQNLINLDNGEFSGTTIVDQFDPETQSILMEAAISAVTDTSLLYLGVQFPLLGVVISGYQGSMSGYDTAIAGGVDPYEAIMNGIVGGTVNAGVGLLGNKVGGLGKLKITDVGGQVIIDVYGALITGFIGGVSTEAVTNYNQSSRDYDYGYGTAGGGVNMEVEYYDH